MELGTAVASRVVQATSAAAHAVTTCDEALLHARGVVDTAGNDDAAALAALDASVRCAAASLAALELATRCEAAAEEAGVIHRAAAAMAAQEARAAAARCDVEGAAAAASAAAIAFAESCVAACGDAATLTLAAGEAAARCVLARDDATTAALVLGQVHEVADRKAARESAQGHKKACKVAVAASLGARKAAVHCAAASRRAMPAPSVAREAASRCDADAAGGDGAAEAAEAARRAAERCVAAASEADAAAASAREAAASCDAAVANTGADADKEDFLDKMRGWVMTVATLFVGIAFQAIAHPPDGMSWDQCGRSWSSKTGKTTSRAPWPSPAAFAGSFTSSTACSYLLANTVTMAVALALLVELLTMKKATSRITLVHIQVMLVSLTFMVAASFITSIPGDQRLQQYILIFFGLYAITTFLLLKISTAVPRSVFYRFLSKGKEM